MFTKKLESLLHTYAAANYTNSDYCPHCRAVVGKGDIFEERVLQKHYNCNSNFKLELPPTGATMNFKSSKTMFSLRRF